VVFSSVGPFLGQGFVFWPTLTSQGFGACLQACSGTSRFRNPSTILLEDRKVLCFFWLLGSAYFVRLRTFYAGFLVKLSLMDGANLINFGGVRLLAITKGLATLVPVGGKRAQKHSLIPIRGRSMRWGDFLGNGEISVGWRPSGVK
jgi:hypothetical protein